MGFINPQAGKRARGLERAFSVTLARFRGCTVQVRAGLGERLSRRTPVCRMMAGEQGEGQSSRPPLDSPTLWGPLLLIRPHGRVLVGSLGVWPGKGRPELPGVCRTFADRTTAPWQTANRAEKVSKHLLGRLVCESFLKSLSLR